MGSKGEGDSCSPSATGDDCGELLACIRVNPDPNYTCQRICPLSGTANACPGTETCATQVKDFSTSTGLAFCRATTSCLPIEQTGCPANQACYYADKVGEICAPVPSQPVQPGSACVHANDCAKGSTCLTLGSTGTCFSFCSTADSGACPSGMTCSALGGSSDEANLGACRQQP